MSKLQLKADKEILNKTRIEIEDRNRPIYWSIKLSQSLRPKTVNSTTVRIYDKKGRVQKADVRFNPTTNSIEISQGFVCNESENYVLEIGKGVVTAKNVALKTPIRVNFSFGEGSTILTSTPTVVSKPQTKQLTTKTIQKSSQKMHEPVVRGIKGELHMGEIMWVGHGSRWSWHFEPNNSGYVSLCYDYYNGGEQSIASVEFWFTAYDVNDNPIVCQETGQTIARHSDSKRLKKGKWRVGNVCKNAWKNIATARAVVEKVEVLFDDGVKRLYDKTNIVLVNNDQYDHGMHQASIDAKRKSSI